MPRIFTKIILLKIKKKKNWRTLTADTQQMTQKEAGTESC